MVNGIYQMVKKKMCQRWMDKEDVVCVYEYYIYIYVYNGLLLSHNKEWNNAICSTLLDLEIIILSEVSQTKTNIYYHLYVK